MADQTQQPIDPMSDAIDQTIKLAPELQQSPGLAVSVAQQNPQNAPVVAQQTNRQSVAQAADNVHKNSPGILHDIGSFLGHVIPKPVKSFVDDAAKAANAPLNVVRHEYRYLHDVEARHGLGAATMEGLVATGGAAVGFAAGAGNPTTAALGAEAATYLEGQLTFKDSWQRTANPNYKDPHTGQLVSIGRDIANAVGLNRKSGAFSDLSGVTDGLSVLFADPLALAGRTIGAAQSLEGIKGGLLARRYVGTAITPDRIEHAMTSNDFVSRQVQRAFDQIAQSTPGEISMRYPEFNPILERLGNATTRDEVAQVFREIASAGDTIQTTGRLPTMSFTRIPFSALRESAENVQRGPVQSVSKMLTRLPGRTWDPATRDFVSTINPGDTAGVRDLMSVVRYYGTRQEAEDIGSSYVYATPGERVGMVKNVILKSILSRAHVPVPDEREYPDLEDYLAELTDPLVKQAIAKRLNQHIEAVNPEGVDPDRIFGMTIHGKPVNPMVKEDGSKFQGAITQNQVGRMAMPSLIEVKRMAAAVRASKTSQFLAGADDALFNHFTQGIFKPLVLQSVGYALHISMAELIPNTLRHGFLNSAKVGYQRALANLGHKEEEGDLGHFTGWAWRVLGERMFEHSQDAQHLAELYALTGGYRTLPGLAAGENIRNEVKADQDAQVLRQSIGRVPMKTSNDFTAYGNEEAKFPQYWRDELWENARNSESRVAADAYLTAAQRGASMERATESARQATANYLRSLPQDALDNIANSSFKREGDPDSWDPIDSWANAIVEKMKGAVHGREDSNFKLHTQLLQDIVNGRPTPLRELEEIPTVERPLQVKGRLIVPAPAANPIAGLANALGNSRVGFPMLNRMVNFLSRNQEMALEYLKQRRPLEEAVQGGIYTPDQAATIAASRATNNAIRFVHNLHDRTQWSGTLRNVAPFWFAQEQAYRRVGRLLAENPGAFAQYMRLIMAVHTVTASQNQGGVQYIMFPGSGLLGRGVPSMFNKVFPGSFASVSPAEFGGTFSSANVVFPLAKGFNPELGPVAAIPTRILGNLFPELGKKFGSQDLTDLGSASQWLAGYYAMSQPWWEQLIPNTFVQRAIETASGDDRSFNSAFVMTLQALYYEQTKAEEAWIKGGRKGPQPDIAPPQDASYTQKQQFLNRVKNQTRIRFATRAILGYLSPVSADVVIGDYGFRNDVSAEIKKAGSVSTGVENFLSKHPDATPWTVFQSTDQNSGLSLPSSVEAEDWITKNSNLINRYPAAAMWLMPQLKDNKYNATVYNEQIAQGLRVKRTPQQFLDALYTASGDQVYYAGLTQHENALTAIGKNKTAESAEYQAWDNYVTQLEQAAPTWAQSFLAGDKQVMRQQTIKQLQDIFSRGIAPKNEQSSLVQQLLTNYEAAAAAYAQANSKYNYQTLQSQIRQQWIAYVGQIATQYPQLKPIVTSVFRNALDVRTY